MSNINVSYDEMQREANNLVTAKDQIIADLNRLQAQIQGLVESGFVTDQASVRFNESYQQFTTGAQQTMRRSDEHRGAVAGHVVRDAGEPPRHLPPATKKSLESWMRALAHSPMRP
ncbi:WXG100 family type VII secretion target [Georgenia sp. SUBG003]|uniref:WXG100 family type VII secretion target n=1 Tax=Georgenia sp. SUBG003 TaxID=1497974 RepID=UPI003AB4DD54